MTNEAAEAQRSCAMTQTHTAKTGQVWVSWLQAMLVTVYHIAYFSNCWQKAPEMGAAGGNSGSGQLGITFWNV